MPKSEIVQRILLSLKSAKRPTEPWCDGTIASADVGLRIANVGPVKLPLRPANVRKLCRVASQASYGKREDTIVDTTVRDTLEIDAEAVELSAEFNQAVQAASRQVAEQLQLDADRLGVELYKLLIYTKGGFFLPHRDSEKRRGMVATMIVVLPSRYGGGELVVRHEGHDKVFSFSDARNQSHPQFAAFFADCEHEVKKVTSGVRVCLAFNLILMPQRTKGFKQSDSTADPELLRHVGDWIRERASDPLVFALEHQYTEAGLKPSLLKGADKELYRHVAAVSESLDCRLHLGQVSRHLCQHADDGNFSYGRRGYRGWSGDYEDLDIGEVYDDEIAIDGWKDVGGNPVSMAAFACDSSQLISATPVEDWIPSRQDYEGYTGNAGNTLDRWYHKSAIAIWPRSQHFEIVSKMGLEFAVSQLLQMRKELPSKDDDTLEQACDDCQMLAEAIIRHWPNRIHERNDGDQDRKPWLRQFAAELPKFEDPALIEQLLHTVAARDWHVKLDQLVSTSLRLIGASEIFPLLCELIEFDPPPNQYGNRFLEGLAERDADWLLKLATDKKRGGLDDDQLQGLVAIAVKKVSAHLRRIHTAPFNRTPSPTAAWLTLCKVTIALDDDNLELLLQLPRECSKAFDLRKFQVSAATTLRDFSIKRSGAIPSHLNAWIEELRVWLEATTAEEPMPPSTWARKAETGCNCPFCKQLREFLKDPAQEITQIAARADRRTHLLGVIRTNRLDVTTELIRHGSPQSLELTKTTASHQEDLKQYKSDQQLLESLQKKT